MTYTTMIIYYLFGLIIGIFTKNSAMKDEPWISIKTVNFLLLNMIFGSLMICFALFIVGLEKIDEILYNENHKENENDCKYNS